MIRLTSTYGQQGFVEEFTLPHTLRVETLQNGATPLIAAHVQRLLSHTRAGSIFPSRLPTPFDHTLAKGLGLGRHCIPLLSPLSSHKVLKRIYRLSPAKRQLLSNAFLEDFRRNHALVKGNRKKLASLRKHYDTAHLITTLQGPILYLPAELLGEILLTSVEELGVSQSTLQQVSKSWRAVVARLWGVLRVYTWTETRIIRAFVKRNPSSMAVVIDTAIDEDVAPSVPLGKPYAALALAWTSASRWRSLTINSFPSIARILSSNCTLSTRVPLESLESLRLGPGCDPSDYINETMEAIASTATPKLTNLVLATTTVIQRLNPSHWAHIYSQLTALEVDVIKLTEPVDLLRHCARLEELKLSGVVTHHLPHDELPLLRTLRRLWLRRTSVQWMVGRTFKRLDSCTLLRPVDTHTIGQTSVICLPLCTNIAFQSHLIGVLAAFHAPVVNKIEIKCNQWTKVRASLELGRVWSQRRNQGMLQPKILSLQMLCGDQALLKALEQMVTLEELNLDVPHPNALGRNFFESLCAVPKQVFIGVDKEQWTRWAAATEWQTQICPSLVKLQLRYERWLRQGEMDVATPLFVAVAWTRAKLPFPLKQFVLELGEDDPLQLVGMTYRDDPTFKRLWRDRVPLHDHQDMLYISCITLVRQRTIGFIVGTQGLPLRGLGQQYYSSLFRRLREFHHHPSFPQGPCSVLPFFEHLEVLDITNFHIEPCSPAANIPLCRTLRILHGRNIPLDWMDGRTFERVTECLVRLDKNERGLKLTRVEMPVCKRMEFIGSYMEILGYFLLPRLDLLHLGCSRREESSNDTSLIQDLMLLIQSIHPRVVKICTEDRNEGHIPALWSETGMDGVVVKNCWNCGYQDAGGK